MVDDHVTGGREPQGKRRIQAQSPGNLQTGPQTSAGSPTGATSPPSGARCDELSRSKLCNTTATETGNTYVAVP